MTLRRRVPALVGLALLAPLAAAQAQSAPVSLPSAGATGLRIQLRVVDACRVQDDAGTAGCATAHQRSDAPVAPPPQVQALTPAPDGEPKPRAWQTLTF